MLDKGKSVTSSQWIYIAAPVEEGVPEPEARREDLKNKKKNRRYTGRRNTLKLKEEEEEQIKEKQACCQLIWLLLSAQTSD